MNRLSSCLFAVSTIGSLFFSAIVAIPLRWKFVCVAAMVLGNLSVDAVASIDQQYVPATSNSSGSVADGVDQAQTFTVGFTGLFTGFDFWATRNEATTLPL